MSSNLYSAAVSLNERCVALVIADTRKLSDFRALYYASHAESQQPMDCTSRWVRTAAFRFFDFLSSAIQQRAPINNTSQQSVVHCFQYRTE